MKAGKTLGRSGEDLAVEYLKRQDYEILGTNFRFDRAEVDVIAKDGDVLVFVEVKARRSRSYGDPEEAVTRKKEDQIRRVAEGYLYEHNIEEVSCRFDVVAITYIEGRADVRLIRDAF